MKSLTHFLLPVALCCSAAPLSASDTPVLELAALPEIGVRLRREISTHYLLVAETMRSVVNGEEAISQRLFDVDSTQNLTVVDELLEQSEGRATRFRRDYLLNDFKVESKRSLGRQESKDKEYKGKGSVQGKGVMFTWQPEESEYGRYYDSPKEGIEEVLPGLTADLSMNQLLPPGPVEPGATWDLSPGTLVHVLACGGETDFGLKGEVGYSMLRTMRLGLGLNIEQAFGGKEEGTVKAFLMGTEVVEGRELALIQLTFDIQLERDHQERAQSGMSIQELSRGFFVKSALVELELSGSGTVRWDINGGYVHDTQNLKGSQRVGTTLIQARKTEAGESDESTQQLVLVGTMSHSVVCTPVQ